MAGDADGTQFTLLGAETTVDQRGLAAYYRYPDGLQSCWVRANMITSADGGATRDGRSGGLGAAGDRALFGTLRQLADVILVGAGTVRTENYSGVQFDAARRAARQRAGQAEVPPIAVLTRTGRLDRECRLFERTEVAPLILTCTDSVADTRARLGDVAEVFDVSRARPGSVDLPAVLDLLAQRGLYRVLAEGGPAILGALIAESLLDELCVTVAPLLVGGPSARIVTGGGAVATRMRPAAPLTDADGFLYLRYLRADDPR
ncbi:hypothetical protein CRI77_04540 [Mycolicibacterium duvalii]|nr:pyrimidine reductase family protein [Mycolicibacterium duvalii]MCV7369738.1 pyrimidine reductase family protein [Mycolicibacterium duvalii]PEG43453.1 hypothetical protein CRI77_04540 [Mycolicibacterium duvalii]